jgi:hypothetical protein
MVRSPLHINAAMPDWQRMAGHALRDPLLTDQSFINESDHVSPEMEAP